MIPFDLTPQQVSERLGVSERTLAAWRSAGKGPPYRKIGRTVTYPEPEVLNWADQQIVRKTGANQAARRPAVVSRVGSGLRAQRFNAPRRNRIKSESSAPREERRQP